MKHIAWLICVCLWSLAASAEPVKVGLVLSGGGTKGGAHIGVLKALELHNIKVSYVVGTSVGAVIGAMYATGMSAEDIEQAIAAIDWDDVLKDEPSRPEVPIQIKRGDFDYLVKAKLGFSKGQVKFPLGLAQGQKITGLLRQLLHNGGQVQQFDDLAIPFRAVATSLDTGEAVVLASGDLPLSVRASMSLPGLFAPVDIDGQYLVDGGVAANLPIDVARQMGAERVIAVDITAPLQGHDTIHSVFGVTQQLINIMTRRNVDEQLSKLTAADVLIRPEVSNINTFDFANIHSAVQPGYLAASQLADKLQLLAELSGPADTRSLVQDPPPMLSFVDIADNSGLGKPAVMARLNIALNQPFDRNALDKSLSRLYGSGLYQRIDYKLLERDGATGLSIDAEAKSWGPDYLQFGLRLEEDFTADANFNIGMAYLKTGLNSLGAQWRTQLDLGSLQGIKTEWFQPWSIDGKTFSRFQLGFERNNLRVYSQRDKALQDLSVREFGGLFSLGQQIGRAAEIDLSWRRLYGQSSVLVGERELADNEFDVGELSFNYRLDTLNRTNRPSNGSLVRITTVESSRYSGATDDYRQLHGTAIKAFDLPQGQLALTAIVGTTRHAEAPLQSRYVLGGLGRLSGYPADRFFGQQVAYFRANASTQTERWSIPIYLGASIEMGNTWDRGFTDGPEQWISAASLYTGFDTFLGPVYLAAGFAEGGNQAVYLYLGNPFAARAIRPFD
jgi:NTE family protein